MAVQEDAGREPEATVGCQTMPRGTYTDRSEVTGSTSTICKIPSDTSRPNSAVAETASSTLISPVFVFPKKAATISTMRLV